MTRVVVTELQLHDLQFRSRRAAQAAELATAGLACLHLATPGGPR